MEFWGVEVKAGQPLKVVIDDDKMIHLSQASLGESKKENAKDTVPLFVTLEKQKLVLGTLSSGTIPQIAFDLVFEKEFELSHNWKNGSVYFCGYKADFPEEEEQEGYSDFDSGSEEEINLAMDNPENGKPELKEEKPKLATAKASKAKIQAKPVMPKDNQKSEDDSENDSDESEDDDDTDVPADADLEDSDNTDDSDDLEEDESDDGDMMSEDEETPKKVKSSSKRVIVESGTKTPVPTKRMKVEIPQKTDGKKGNGHVATPHPAKTPAAATSEKSKTPKSTVICNTCSKSFNSDVALQSHTKAKHEAK